MATLPPRAPSQDPGVSAAGTEARVARLLLIGLSAPIVLALIVALWRMPYGIAETVAILEDLENKPLADLVQLDGTYARPGFWLTLSALWPGAASVGKALERYKLLHVAMAVALLVVFAARLRVTKIGDAAAALFALTVLIGSAGFRDNLENLPLNQMLFVMIGAVICWSLVEQSGSWRRSVALVAVAIATLAFKEQGLAVIAVVLTAAAFGAPGASRWAACALMLLLASYLTTRLQSAGEWPVFAQAIGVGFEVIEPRAAVERFGAMPLAVYGYNAAATAMNVLFGEPTSGVFSVTAALRAGEISPAQLNQVLAVSLLTLLIVLWAVRCGAAARGPERRTVLMFVSALIVSALLGFNYTRDRFAGVAAVFYAACAFYAMRWAVTATFAAQRRRACVIGCALALLACGWQLRAIGTVKMLQDRAWSIRREWLTDVPERRQRFADRPEYLMFLNALYDQGSNPRAHDPAYPRWVSGVLGSW